MATDVSDILEKGQEDRDDRKRKKKGGVKFREKEGVRGIQK